MATTRQQTFDWAGHTARMISSIGRDEVAAEVVAALSALIEFEHTGVFLFRRHTRPRDLLAECYGGRYHQTYFGGTYRLDPFYRGAERSGTGGLYRMAELDPGYQSYLDRYEMGPRVADILPPGQQARPADSSGKLGEEIGFLLPVGGARIVHVALIRSTALGPFVDREIDDLKTVAPVLQAVFESHFRRRVAAGFAEASEPVAGSEMTGAAASWRQRLGSRLTVRERELVEYMLLGLHTEQIAARMGISGATVKVHRRNIYRKLAVSSRDELVARCFANGLRPAGGI